jgi:uncharacterized protein YndB with AHSA1/START domain
MTDIVVRRFIPVPRERAFAAWLDPQSLVRWMLPGAVRNAGVEAAARVGGRFRIVMEHGRGGSEHWGEYLAIDPPSLLSFTWISAATNRLPTTVTIEFHERGGGTELVLTHRGLPPAQAAPHQNGWGDIVRKFGEAITSISL